MVATRSSSKSVNARSGAGRKRKAESSIKQDVTHKHSKQRRIDDATVSDDQQWLQEALIEFRRLKYPRSTNRHETVEIAKQYLSMFKRPTETDAHFFDDQDEARRFLSESNVIDVPIFVTKGANFSRIDPASNTRPIEQLFEILPNMNEPIEYDDQSQASENKYVKTTMGHIQQRFFEQDNLVRYPVNFPDISTHVLDHGLPRFVQSPTCMLLHDMLRLQLDVNEEHVCNCRKPNVPHCRHEIERNEFLRLTTAWIYWQGTTMLSEPGTAAHPHWDQYGMATWISCLEGEIGFAWLVRPTRDQHVRWVEDKTHPKGRWAFRVLRPGDSLYMPSGTVHFVFRRPSGSQTLAFAGHILRNQDLSAWLKVLSLEMLLDLHIAEKTGEKFDEMSSTPTGTQSPHEYIVPPLMREVRKLIEHAGSQKRESKYGGKKKLSEALRFVKEVEDKLTKLGKS